MEILKSYIMGATNEINAISAVLTEVYGEDEMEEIMSLITHSPGFKVKYEVHYKTELTTIYVYPIGDGWYRLDFCNEF